MRSVQTIALVFALGCNPGDTSSGASDASVEASDGGSKAKKSKTKVSSGDAVEPVEVIATVGGVPITKSEFEQVAARKTPEDGKSLSAAEKQEVLDKLVEEKILYLKALDNGLDEDPKVQKVMVNTLLREEVYSKVRNSDFADDELRAYYEEHKDEFVVPEKVQIKRILIRTTDERPAPAARAEAERLRKEVVSDPTNFKELATKFSEGPYKRRGGDLGFVSDDGKPGVDSAIVEQAFELDVESVSDVFKTDEGFNVIYVANRRDKVERTFQQMKGSVLRKLKNERLQEWYDEYVTALRGSGPPVDIVAAALAAIEVENLARPGLRPGGGLTPSGPHGGAELPEGLPGIRSSGE
jgi:parvulin-like peptidyl-prolyl isomerase